MHIPNFPRFIPRLCLSAGLAFACAAASAASPCKGMEQSACVADGACIWIDGYTRKDGRTVASHCKLKGGSTSGQQASVGSARPSTAE